MTRRIGIYSGTFDPVHAGHIAFSLQALTEAKLDMVYFLPERRPRYKVGVEHFGHRVAMLKRAAKPHKKFGVLELPDVSFTVDHTLPRLVDIFNGHKLIFLMGSDEASRIIDWPNAGALIAKHEIVIGLRSGVKKSEVNEVVKTWPTKPPAIHIFSSYAPSVSSGKIREALGRRELAPGLLASVNRYVNSNWLYASISQLTKP